MIIVLMFQSLREQNLRMEAAVSESKYECLLFGEFRLQTQLYLIWSLMKPYIPIH